LKTRPEEQAEIDAPKQDAKASQSWPADKIERRSVESLIPYARNARTHSDAQVAQIAASIKEWGWTTPVLVDESGEIIAGHGRVMAARKLGIEEVPTMTAVGWTKAQKQAYVLADNQLPQNAGWDMDLLKIEMQDLSGEGFDLSLIGFGDDFVSALNPESLDKFPFLPYGEKEPFQQMTFTLHDEQVEQVKAAMETARSMGAFVDSPNENGNGNALARACEMFVTQNANS
jgi:ParB family transcriptional regulator, chromosome partitioning protein